MHHPSPSGCRCDTSTGYAWGLERRAGGCIRGVGTLPVGHRVAPPQQDRPVQVLLLRTVHEDGKFSMMASAVVPLGTVPLPSGTTSLSGPGSLVHLAHMAQFLFCTL